MKKNNISTDIKETLRDMINRYGEVTFDAIHREILKEMKLEKQKTCTHSWHLSQIAGDGYTCTLCGKWMLGDD